MKKTAFILLIALLSACSSVPTKKEAPDLTGYEFLLYETPRDLITPESQKEAVTAYAPYLTGLKIFLDPGHGGEDRHGRSPDGSVVEADVNLRVGLALRDFLEEAGATVFMSRTTDETVGLKYRSELANKSGADIFISIHHNAPGGDGNYWTNYTSTYYHASPEYYEYEPCNRNMARYVQRDLAYVMGNSGGLGSFDGTYTDYWIYPGDGFSVLRETDLPAILIEGSFWTNRKEIMRLNDENFNRYQAWGIFKGLGKYFKAGVPGIVYLDSKSGIEENSLNLYFQLKDESGIDRSSIRTYIDSVETSFNFIEEDSLVYLTVRDPKPGELEVRVVCANNNGNYSFPYHRKIVIN